jgi:iron complex outermembrane receptor protein
MPKFSRKALLLCCAAVPALATTAFAQEVNEEREDDVIVVRGIKKAIEDSLETKKQSTSIVEAISAEDIGKLPDLSIADSLARLPGLTAQRVRGRAQQISIRGLGPDFSVALLNGREQVSAGDNRGIEFDQFPAELIAQGLVYKTPEARLAANGIAGTIDLRTVRPLDYSDRQITASGRYVFNDNGELNPDFDADGYRLFASYIDQFANDTLGIALAVTTQSNPVQNVQRELKTNSGQVSLTEDGFFYPTDNPRTGAQSREFDRTSVAGTLEWRPDDANQVTLDAFYSDFEDSGIFRGVETPLPSWAGAELESYTASDGIFVDSAAYANVWPVLRTDVEGRSAELFSGGINWESQWTDRFSTILDYSISTVDRTDIDFESYAGLGASQSERTRLSFFFPEEGDYAYVSDADLTDPNTVLLTDPGGWGQVGFVKEPEIEDTINQLRAEAAYDIERGPFGKLRLGILYTDREKTRDSIENFIDFADGVAPNNELQIPSSAIIGSTDVADELGQDIIAYDPFELLNNGTYALREANFVSVITKAWEVREEILDYYLQAEIDTLVSGMPLRGNVGFKYQEIDQESDGASARNGVTDNPTVTRGDDYSHFLPSVNLGLEFMPDTFLRLSYAKAVTRPRMDDLRASQELTVNSLVCPDPDGDGIPEFDPGQFNPNLGNFCLTSSGGNPQLRPFESNNYDVSFEKYFGSAGAIAIAYFYKDLDEYVFPGATFLVDNSELVTELYGADFLAANPDAALGSVSGPINSQGGTIEGFEVALNLPFDGFVPLRYEGFGSQFSYSNTQTEVEISADGETITVDIPGYSEEVWNASLYYENYGWRARLNARYRSDYFAELPNFDGELNFTQGIEETVVDAQFGYTFQGGPLEGVSILFEGYNLTDEPFGTIEETGGTDSGITFPSIYELYGRSYNVQVSYTW